MNVASSITTITIKNDDIGKLKHIQDMYKINSVGFKIPIGKLLVACALHTLNKVKLGKLKLEYINGVVIITDGKG